MAEEGPHDWLWCYTLEEGAPLRLLPHSVTVQRVDRKGAGAQRQRQEGLDKDTDTEKMHTMTSKRPLEG